MGLLKIWDLYPFQNSLYVYNYSTWPGLTPYAEPVGYTISEIKTSLLMSLDYTSHIQIKGELMGGTSGTRVFQ